MIKRGDRFEWNDSIWEILEVSRYSYSCKVFWVSGRHHWIKNPITLFITSNWTYLGNFGKSNNFDNLYDILCEK